jgi:hypothetical protein
MKKNVILGILSLFWGVFSINAQVSIGISETPNEGSLLQLKEIAGVNDDAVNAYRGLAMPRVNLTEIDQLFPMFLDNPDDPTSGPNAVYQANKLALDKIHVGLTVYNLNATVPFEKGIYNWTGTQWEAVSQSKLKAGNGLTMSNDSLKLGGALIKSATLTLGANDLIFDATGAGKIGIGTTPSEGSAILEVNATDKGVLLPRVTLTSNTDQTTILNPAVGLLVYNTGTDPGYTVSGYLFWGGDSWKTIDNFVAIEPTVSGINCATAYLTPATYMATQSYNGILRLTYTGGNGASYQGGATQTVNGLKIQLQSGRLENGNGELVFKVWGTPTVTTPDPTSFTINKALIPFYTGSSCSATVGNTSEATVRRTAVMEPFSYTTQAQSGREGYEVVAKTPNGNFSVRVFIPIISSSVNFENANLQIKSHIGTVDIASNEQAAWAGDSGAYGRYTLRVTGSWCGNGNNSNNNNNVTSPVEQSSSNFPNWGDQAIYWDGKPESRTYFWTNKADDAKTFYTFRFMMYAPTGSVSNPKTGRCSSGKCTGTKVFFLIEEVTAN